MELYEHEYQNQVIAALIGAWFKQLRLRKNITLETMHERTLLSINTLKSLEKGQAKLSTMIAVLREMEMLDELSHLFLATKVGQGQPLKSRNKTRQRARQVRPPQQKSFPEINISSEHL